MSDRTHDEGHQVAARAVPCQRRPTQSLSCCPSRYAPSEPDAPFFFGASGNSIQTSGSLDLSAITARRRHRCSHAYDEVRIYDLRHTFICRRVQRWQAEGYRNPIVALATYVGHATVSDTYCCLTGIHDLMPWPLRSILSGGVLSWVTIKTIICGAGSALLCRASGAHFHSQIRNACHDN